MVNRLNRVAVPFLKWAGGKSLTAGKIISRLGRIPPDAYYFEAFLGGGAVFFKLRPKNAVLIDSNLVLIRTWEVVKQNVEELIARLEEIPAPANKREFNAKRNEFNDLLPPPDGQLNSEDFERAALLIWLNHTCYNGLFRVNREGKFNVPFGYYNRPFIFRADNLRAASQTLNAANAKLIPGDYSIVLDLAKRGDVLYFDPPYHPLGSTSNFTEYTSEGFGLNDQEKLASIVKTLIQRGCHPVVSNSSTREINDLYAGLSMEGVSVPRAINCIGTKRGAIQELIIYQSNRTTLHDQWTSVIQKSKFNLDGTSIFEITSKRVKELTGQEPRLVAKMDTREELPSLLASSNYFVLPVSNRKYAIVPGDGYHDLEEPQMEPGTFTSKQQIPVSIALKAGESAAVQTALYSGLLEEITGVQRLRPTLHNDRLRLGSTTIRYGDAWSLNIDGAQIEVDAGFEDTREFFLFECKNWYRNQLHDFNIRQLFFPYLHARKTLTQDKKDWKIRSFFLNVEPDTSVYRFWEYDFPRYNDYTSMRFINQAAFRLEQGRARNTDNLLESFSERSVTDTDYIPQADDAQKLIGLIQGIAEGYDTARQVAQRFQFDIRQSSYYGEAAEAIGLVERDRGKFSLTEIGSKAAGLQTDKATRVVIEQIFSLPVFHDIAVYALQEKSSVVPQSAIRRIMLNSSRGRYNETTLSRRVQTVSSWLNWIGETTGVIRVQTHEPAVVGRPIESY